MAETIVANGQWEQKVVYTGSATATSSDTETVIATIDARGFALISVTAKNAGAQNVYVNVYGYNDPAYSDESVVSGSTLNARQTDIAAGVSAACYAGSNGVTTTGSAVFSYYRVKLVNKTTSAGHASATTVYWCLKNT